MVTNIVDPLKVLTELNDNRRVYKTTYLNGKTILKRYKYVTSKQLKKAEEQSDILYILQKEEHSDDVNTQTNIVIYKDPNIINEIILTHIYQKFNTLSNFLAKHDIKSLKKSTNISIPHILITEVCVKILNLEVNNVIEYKEGTKRRVVNNILAVD